MPSPVGHLLAGAAVYIAGTKKNDRLGALFGVTLFGSILPDLDFVPGILIGEPAAFHHGISHSCVFGIFYGVLIFLLFHQFQRSTAATQAGILSTLAYGSHLVLDVVSVNDGARGIPIIWPISSERFGTNLGLFGHFHHGALNDGIWSVVRWDNVPALLSELFVIGMLVLFLFWREHYKSRSAKPINSRSPVDKSLTSQSYNDVGRA